MKERTAERKLHLLDCYEAIIFDMDGVLFDTPKIYYELHRRIAYELNGYTFTFDDQQRLMSTPRRKGVKSIQTLTELIGFPVSSADIDELADLRDRYFMETIGFIGNDFVKTGARELLTLLRVRGKVVTLATSSSHDQLTTLFEAQTEIGYADFDMIMTSDLVPEYLTTRDKTVVDQALVAKLALQDSLITPNKCVLIEDSVSGVNSGKNANIGFIIAVPDDDTRQDAERGNFRFTNANLVAQDLMYLYEILK
jgi:beta-phosphoglucomutase